MSQAKSGDTVKIHYTGTLDDGSQFDSSAGREPLEFTLGSGQVIPGFDKAVEGMAVGDTKTVNIPADEAYGPRHDGMIQEVPLSALPDDLEPQVGMGLQARRPDGGILDLTITEVGEEAITVDGNHPLAGQTVYYSVEVREVRKPSEEELAEHQKAEALTKLVQGMGFEVEGLQVGFDDGKATVAGKLTQLLALLWTAGLLMAWGERPPRLRPTGPRARSARRARWVSSSAASRASRLAAGPSSPT